MQTQIIVTDIVKKPSAKVGIAGYTKEAECVRLVMPPPGIPESILIRRNELVIFPFASIELNLREPRPDPPFSEDFSFDPFTLRFAYEELNREEILKWSLYQNIEEIFEQKIFSDPEAYIFSGEGPRSLGTIIPQRLIKILYEPPNSVDGDWWMIFMDGTQTAYRLKISDLSWFYFCKRKLEAGRQASQIAGELFEKLKKSQLYLRIGLDRLDIKPNNRCYLEITGIYSFPDYLENHSLSNLIRNID